MVVVSHLFFLFSDKFREGMTRCESYPLCSRTIYFPTAHILNLNALSVFWNKSYLTLRKPALQERQKFFYTVVHFFTFMENVTKNNLIITQFQRYPRCSSFFVF